MPKHRPPLNQLFFPEERLVNLASLAAHVQGTRIEKVRVPTMVMSAIRELNDLSLFANGAQLGSEKATRQFMDRIRGASPGNRGGTPDERGRAIVSQLSGLGGLAGPRRPCGDSISRAEEVLHTAFGLDARTGNREPKLTSEAAAYMRGRLRTVAHFEGELWRNAGSAEVWGDGSGRERPDPGRPVEPQGGSGGGLVGPGEPSEPIFPPDHPLPDPAPDDLGPPDGIDPGLCEHLAGLCTALYEEAAAALLGDPYIDLIDTVAPDCLCRDFDPNQQFVARPAAGRQFPVPLGDLRLIFRGAPITGNIIQPTTADEIRFTLPANAETGFVYLRGLFPIERTGVAFPERLCGMSLPDFPNMPQQGPAATISIIHPPVIDVLTADGDPGPVVVVPACREVDVCWHAHLEDQLPHLPLPPCASIEVIIRDDAGDTLHAGTEEGCFAIGGREDQALTIEVRSFAGNVECGTTDPIPLVLERVLRVTLTHNDPADEELIAGSSGNFIAEVSCPAPAGGVTVRLRSTPSGAIQVPAEVEIPEDETQVEVEFTSDAEFRGRVDVRGAAPGHQESWLAFHMIASPAEVCASREELSGPWSKEGEPWANWGVIDSNDTFLGFLPSPRLFRPTSQYETAQAIRRAEALGRTVRALGSGWSFSEAVLPQESAFQAAERVVAGPIRALALLGFFTEEVLHAFATNFSGRFGDAIDTTSLDRSLQVVLPDILADGTDASGLFFAEAGMTINFLNTLLDAQTPRVALPTMGGASGQTIAGAFSTGTHGADYERPPLADAVRAIYLVGEGGTHHWIEPADAITDPARLRATYPCIADHIHYDDDMFRATLVSLGAMGVIYAVILDVVPQYSLLQWNRWSTWEQFKADQVANDFAGLLDGSWTGMADFLRDEFDGGFRPNRFAQVVVNSGRNEDGTHNCYVSNRAQFPLRAPGGVQPLTDLSLVQDEDISDAIAAAPEIGIHSGIHLKHHAPESTGDQLTDLQNLLVFLKDRNYPWAVRAVIDKVMQLTFPLPDSDPQVDVGHKVMAPGGESRLFPPLGGTSIEAALSLLPTLPAANQPGLRVVVPDVVSYLDAVLDAYDQAADSDAKRFAAGWISLRITGRTAALLGMQRFELSGMVEISLIGRPDGYGLIRLAEQIARIQGAALHWGQSNGMMNFLDLEGAYGNNRINRWKAVQRALGGDTFTNLFMRRCGLA